MMVETQHSVKQWLMRVAQWVNINSQQSNRINSQPLGLKCEVTALQLCCADLALQMCTDLQQDFYKQLSEVSSHMMNQ